MDRAGLVGADETTHAGSFDIGYMGQLPGMVLMAPSDEAELAQAVATAVAIDDRPSAFRYPRGERGVKIPGLAAPLRDRQGPHRARGLGRSPSSRFGTRLGEALKAADMLAARGFSATVADARFAKPLDIDLILRLAREHEALITVEEGSMGGFGAFVLHALAEHGALDRGLKVRTLVLPDVFQDQDKPEAMYAAAGLDADGILGAALAALGMDNPSQGRAGWAWLPTRAREVPRRRRPAPTMSPENRRAVLRRGLALLRRRRKARRQPCLVHHDGGQGTVRDQPG